MQYKLILHLFIDILYCFCLLALYLVSRLVPCSYDTTETPTRSWNKLDILGQKPLPFCTDILHHTTGKFCSRAPPPYCRLSLLRTLNDGPKVVRYNES